MCYWGEVWTFCWGEVGGGENFDAGCSIFLRLGSFREVRLFSVERQIFGWVESLVIHASILDHALFCGKNTRRAYFAWVPVSPRVY